MPVPIRSPGEIEQIRRAGIVLRRILETARSACVPGATTREVDSLVRHLMMEAGAVPAADARNGAGDPFPGACSICLNEEAVHGVPGPRVVRAGDVVTIDAALRLAGWCTDAAIAFVIPPAGDDDARLAAAARRALDAAMTAMRPGIRWSAVAAIARRIASDVGCAVIGGWAGHGIGRAPHEPPALPPEPTAAEDFTLRPGMVVTLEPILTLGRPGTVELDDGFTVCTADRARACHEERTIAVTRRGPIDLTAL